MDFVFLVFVSFYMFVMCVAFFFNHINIYFVPNWVFMIAYSSSKGPEIV